MTVVNSAGVVRTLWRYPIKSMIGESCPSLVFDRRGVVGDRLFAVRDEHGKFGSGKNTRRFVKVDGLFRFTAKYDGDVPVVTFPDGKQIRGDDPSIHAELSQALDRTLTLAREKFVSHYDNGPVHLITTASLEWLRSKLPHSIVDERRFRPNIVVETEQPGLIEKNWVGERFRIGGVELEITKPTERCLMTNFAQPGIPEDGTIFASIGREAGLQFGIYANVLTAGKVNCGDQVEIV